MQELEKKIVTAVGAETDVKLKRLWQSVQKALQDIMNAPVSFEISEADKAKMIKPLTDRLDKLEGKR